MQEPHPTAVIAVDTETTSLIRPYLRSPRRIWDLGIIRREPDGTENTLQAFVRLVDLGLLEMIPARVAMDITVPIADRLRAHLPGFVLEALDIGRFFERHPEVAPPRGDATPAVVPEKQLAELLMSGWLNPGADRHRPTFVGVVPGFDELGLHDLLYRHKWIGNDTPWYYHLCDMCSVLGGALRVPPRWSSDELSRAVGVDPDTYPRHTALGEAQWALDLYDAVFHPEQPQPEPPAADPAGATVPDPELAAAPATAAEPQQPAPST